MAAAPPPGVSNDVATLNKKENGRSKKELIVEKEDLPLTIIYKNRRYILILTRNDKLILNKQAE
jgi:hypothetical protein